MVSVKPKLKTKKEQGVKLKPTKKINILTAKKKYNKAIENTRENNINNNTEPKSNNKKVKYVMPSKYITEDIVNSCLNALLKLTTHHTKKNSIFGVETPIFAEIRCIKIPNNKGNVKL